MATNTYFTSGKNSEQNLYEDLIIESLKMYGQDMYYLPREIISEDTILNEAIESRFGDAYIIEMYVENVDGFEGEGDIISKFGLEIRDQASFIISRRRFETVAAYDNNKLQIKRPREGDLIYVPFSKSLMEIKFVEHEKPFYQLKKLPVYQLKCELFEITGSDKFNLSSAVSPEIDVSIVTAMPSVFLEVSGSIPLSWVVGTRLKQEISAGSGIFIFGDITEIVPSTINPTSTDFKIGLSEISTSDSQFHKFIVSNALNTWDKLVDTNDPLSFMPITRSYDVISSNVNADFSNDIFADNIDIEKDANTILDFNADNPFGNPNIG